MNFWNDDNNLSCRYNEKCEFKNVIVMSILKKKSWLESNEEFKSKIHWKFPNTKNSN